MGANLVFYNPGVDHLITIDTANSDFDYWIDVALCYGYEFIGVL